MVGPRRVSERIVEESSPVGFVRKPRGLPLIRKVLRIFDRFL